MPTGPYTTDTPIQTVMDDPVFGDYGRLLFPADTGYWSGDTLGSLRLTWYHNIDPEETVAIVNHLHTQAAAGETVFYDIYTPEEKAADPDKADTGLFFFRGTPGARWPSATPAGALPTWGPCRTASPTPWSSPAGVQCLCPPLPPRGPDGLRRPGPGHHLRL